MPIADLADLVQTTSDYMKRGDLGAVIDRFIGFAENDIERVIEFNEQQSSVTLALTNGRAALPSNLWMVRSVSTTSPPTRHLNRVSKHFEQSPDDWVPQGYTMDAGEIVVMPKSTEQVRFDYWAKLPRLTAAAPTNWLLTRAPDLMLAGTLYHAMEWAGDDRVDGTSARFRDRMATVRREEINRRFTNAAIIPAADAGLP
jgi:hypothetical protein